MSRIGSQPIQIPENVEVNIDGQKVTIKGPEGQLEHEVRPEIKVKVHGYAFKRRNQVLQDAFVFYMKPWVCLGGMRLEVTGVIQKEAMLSIVGYFSRQKLT